MKEFLRLAKPQRNITREAKGRDGNKCKNDQKVIEIYWITLTRLH